MEPKPAVEILAHRLERLPVGKLMVYMLICQVVMYHLMHHDILKAAFFPVEPARDFYLWPFQPSTANDFVAGEIIDDIYLRESPFGIVSSFS